MVGHGHKSPQPPHKPPIDVPKARQALHQQNDAQKKAKKKADKEKLQYDPEDDVWALDVAVASKGRKYAKSVMDGMKWVRRISTCLCLFPLLPKRAKDGTYSCKFSWTSEATIPFLIGGTIVTGSTVWLFISIICASQNFPNHPPMFDKSTAILRSEEVYMLKRNTVNLVLICASFINTTICMVSVFLRRDYIAKQIVYWAEVVEVIKLDVGKGVAKRVLRHLVALMFFVIVITSLYLCQISPLLAGSGSTLYILLTRPFRPNSHWDSSMNIRKQFFAILILYVVVAGYMYILWFFYNCRILTNMLIIWNNRFQYCLHKNVMQTTRKSKQTGRTSRAHLFQDHLVIFNLIEGVNEQFQVIIESFYLSSMVMIVFEAYGLVHGLFYAEYINCGARRADVIPTFLFLALQLYMYMIVTLEAAGVADEARNVLHIVRRKGMMSAKLDMEMWFMMSMRLSFGGHEDVGIIGAGFFYVTKSFLLGAISAIASHFIIFYQFEVPYAQSVESDPNLKWLMDNNVTTKLLKQLEDVNGTTC